MCILPDGKAPLDDYLVVLGKEKTPKTSVEQEETYDYVPTDEWTDPLPSRPSHNFEPPPPPEENYADMQKPANSRHSNASEYTVLSRDLRPPVYTVPPRDLRPPVKPYHLSLDVFQ